MKALKNHINGEWVDSEEMKRISTASTSGSASACSSCTRMFARGFIDFATWGRGHDGERSATHTARVQETRRSRE